MTDKIRSIIFNILFYGFLTPAVCTLLLPALLFPRGAALWVAETYQRLSHLLEKYVMGLDYEVRGIEHVPTNTNAYLAAAKHYSAYETLKLFLLFRDPSIILKRELLSIPLFGWFLKKLDVIAIDRTNREKSMLSLIEGAKKTKDQNRPIVIFPQGTRVAVSDTTDKKPYKGGIAKVYGATNLPIIPVALNSGLYWPRNSFWKKSGKVIIEFLPPIDPGIPERDVLKVLEYKIETATQKLIEEGQQALASRA